MIYEALNKITSIDEKKNACERRNQSSKKYAFIMREFFGLVELTYFSAA
jgi:hypothetical protein